MEGLNKIYGRGLDYVVVPGSFRPNGATGIVADSTKGQGFTVARTSQGLYTVTFDEMWPAKVAGTKGPGLISLHSSVRLAAGATPAFAVGGVVSQSARTAQIRVYSANAAGTGFIPIDVTSALEIAGNAIQNLANHGGLMAVDSDPRIERINGATDPSIRLRWGSASTAEVQLPNIPIPADLDPASPIYLKLLAGKSGDAAPTATLTAEIHEHPLMDVAAGMFGQGDSWPDDIGGAIVINNTLAGQGIGNAREYSLTIDAADLDGPPGFIVITLTPSNNGAAAIDVYGAYIEYTRLGNLLDMAANADNEVDFIAILQDSLVAA